MFNWKKPKLVEATNSQFQIGERWNYETRPQESDSTFVVQRIETMPDGRNVVHIQLDNLQIPNPHIESGITSNANHLPLSEDALAASARDRVETGLSIEVPEGYYQWRKAWESGKGGVFTLPLKEVVDVLEQAISGKPS